MCLHVSAHASGGPGHALTAGGLRAREADALLKPARRLLDDAVFWQYQSDGLAVFVGPGTLRTFRVPVRFDELVVLAPSFHVKPLLALQPSLLSQGRERGHGSAVRAAAGAIGIGSMIGAAITIHRTLGPAGARFTAAAGLIVLLAVLAVLWPRVVVLPLATVGVCVATALFVRAWRLWWPCHEHSDPQESGRNGPPDAGVNRAFGMASHAGETS